MSLCEAPHGRRPWPDLKLTGEGKEKGKERRGRGARPRGCCRGAPMEGGAERGGAMGLQPLFRGCCFVPLQEEGRRKEGRKERRKRKERERKEKNMNFFSNLKISKKIKDNL
jgi:hypothetical protein